MQEVVRKDNITNCTSKNDKCVTALQENQFRHIKISFFITATVRLNHITSFQQPAEDRLTGWQKKGEKKKGQRASTGLQHLARKHRIQLDSRHSDKNLIGSHLLSGKN